MGEDAQRANPVPNGMAQRMNSAEVMRQKAKEHERKAQALRELALILDSGRSQTSPHISVHCPTLDEALYTLIRG